MSQRRSATGGRCSRKTFSKSNGRGLAMMDRVWEARFDQASGSHHILSRPRIPRAHSSSSGALMSVASTITEKLTAALRPTRLQVVDESHQHAGHVGSRPGGETHFAVVIVSDA